MSVVLTWVASDGTETAWVPDNGYQVLQDPVGWGAPAPMFTLEDYAAFDGASQLGFRRPARGFVVPLEISHPTRLQTRFSELARMLRSSGSLRWEDGTNVRHLKQVVYQGGLDGGFDPTQDGAPVSLALLALDPWWYGPEESVSLPTADPTAFDAAVAFDALLPFDGGASLTVTPSGDADAYPVWRVVGPADEVTVSSAAGAWQTAVALSGSDELVVDTRPGSRGPRLNGGGIDWSLLTESSQLWTLAGSGSVSVISGTVGSSGATSLVMSWEPRFLTP